MAEYDYIDIDLADRLFIARSEILRLTNEIERLRAELRTFVRWGEWLTVEGLCSHDAQEGCTRADHVQHPMFVRWETVRG